MGSELYHTGAQGQCPHGTGQVSTMSSNTRVRVSGQPVATLSATSTIVGCLFQIPLGVGTKPQPCLRVQWLVPALRVRVMSQPVLLKTSSGLCLSAEQIPQGSPAITVTQFRVKGT
jgi:hypothetical protein